MVSGSEGLVVIENFEAWKKSIKELDKGLARELNKGLKSVGHIVASKAADIAESKGLHKTGELVNLLRLPGVGQATTVTKSAVIVKAKAMRPVPATHRNFRDGRGASRYSGKPFNYPSVYEYGKRGAGTGVGPRAFLAPGLAATQGKVMHAMEEVIAETVRKAGFK
jgi:hypothetical protein